MILYGELANFLDGKIDTSVNYARYWHGYLVLFRPLFLVFNISEIRKLLFFIFLVLFIILIKLINQKFDYRIAAIFAVSLICNRLFFSFLFFREFTNFFDYDDCFHLVTKKFRKKKRF